MAKKMKDYQIYKCPYCSCQYYDKSARGGRRVGNPMIECPECKKKSYRSSVLEPALISKDRYFGVRFSSLYGNLRIALIIIYAVFLFLILIKRELYLGIGFVGLSVVLYAFYELAKFSHKKNFLKSEVYEKELVSSFKRLSDPKYASMVIGEQGIDEDSLFFYEVIKKKEDTDL